MAIHTHNFAYAVIMFRAVVRILNHHNIFTPALFAFFYFNCF
jgi:hypothetical protein